MERNQASKLYFEIQSELQELKENNPFIAIYELLSESSFDFPEKDSMGFNYLSDEIEKHPDVLFYKKIRHDMSGYLAGKAVEDSSSK